MWEECRGTRDTRGNFERIRVNDCRVVLPIDREDNRLKFGKFWWYYEPLIIGVRRDNPSDTSGGHSPRRVGRVRNLSLSVLKTYFKLLHKAFSKDMRSTDLKRPTIGHHRFKGVGSLGSGKFFAF